ncbi:glutamyl-tRNA amidotransferase [Rhodothalassium salexigens]|uniref:GatB/YqeY domain-containing protein n=1 Tax=Rhodothalassium salexigens TaxID=1086 RepID=UPI0019143095|nr:GatB/YqeY domain-containing protein [Rhodothalassium salexigens]MBK5910566.1 glutamyl-tRNA amidotransferase [Rhodothalassium salexigens]MBK5920303.1 glutamyl-tRNA amidotransferase [Rhodothalassium salexigens]
MLREQLKRELKDAMRARDATKADTVRLILAAVKDQDIANRLDDKTEQDDDSQIRQILAKMIKQRQESIRAYEDAGRCELAERERDEIGVIERFLPKQLNDREITSACRAVVDEVGAQGLRDIGRCMGTLKARYAGQMDFAKASAKVKEILAP